MIFFRDGNLCNAALVHDVRNIRKYASFVPNICPYGMLVIMIKIKIIADGGVR